MCASQKFAVLFMIASLAVVGSPNHLVGLAGRACRPKKRSAASTSTPRRFVALDRPGLPRGAADRAGFGCSGPTVWWSRTWRLGVRLIGPTFAGDVLLTFDDQQLTSRRTTRFPGAIGAGKDRRRFAAPRRTITRDASRRPASSAANRLGDRSRHASWRRLRRHPEAPPTRRCEQESDAATAGGQGSRRRQTEGRPGRRRVAGRRQTLAPSRRSSICESPSDGWKAARSAGSSRTPAARGA